MAESTSEAMSDRRTSQPDEPNIESAVRTLLTCIRNERACRSEDLTAAQPVPVPPAPPRVTVQADMQKSFPALYTGSLKRKRKTNIPKASVARYMQLEFCLLPHNSDKTPKDETALLQTGLGRRTVTVSENANHEEITSALLDEYPKMKELSGGWLLKKAAGGSGQRKTAPLPQGTEGYTGKILKTNSSNGKNVLYIVPLQETIDTTPLPYSATEFKKMPKHTCMTCNQIIPLPLLQQHITSCKTQDSDEEGEESNDVMSLDSCPVCGNKFPVSVLPHHAALCLERSEDALLDPSDFPSTSTLTQHQSRPIRSYDSLCETLGLSSTSTSPPRQSRPDGVDDSVWRTIVDPGLAANQYRMRLLQNKEDEMTLKVRLDFGEDEDDREARIMNFYKAPNVDFARPFQARIQGDVAIGDGVNRHFLSMTMYKLQHGFKVDVGNSCGAMLFEGMPDHLLPSTSKIFLQNEMFIMAGRMIGHSFLHGGPRLAGVSPAILHVLQGNTPQTATIALEDLVDVEVREIIRPLYEVCASSNRPDIGALSMEQRDDINRLAVEMDYSVLKEFNITWLLHSLLQDAVFGRIMDQLEQLKQGLKESFMLPLFESRPDTVAYVFPRQSEAQCDVQTVLDLIQWPLQTDHFNSRILEFLRQFITTVSQEQLKQLVKFWVGWEIPMEGMKVELGNGSHPTSSTCFRTLRLPGHYESYSDFSRDLEMCLASNDYGFGLL